MNQNKLPADSSAMTLGIIAIVILVVGCCCGLLTYLALILSIIGLVSANKSMRLYALNPQDYSPISYNSVKNARVLNIVAVVLSGLISLGYTIYFLIYGAIFSTMLFNIYDNYQEFEEINTWKDDSIYIDDIEEYNQTETIEDTLVLDSISF